MANRWWVYQRERFPVLAHGALVAAFSFSAVSYSTLLRDPRGTPGLESAVGAFGTALLFFLQLRIADEFKDAEEDRRHRPYRPVPRGLVTLGELAAVGVMAAGVQLALALWLAPGMVVLLVGVWTYLGLMSVEFGVGPWLRRRPVLYLVSHMVIIPLVDFYATACDWWPAGEGAPEGLGWFLLVSYFDGIVLELGRKIRAPEDEEPGVETYSALWGPGRAALVWLGALGVTGVLAARAAARIDFLLPVGVMLAILVLSAARPALRFARAPARDQAKRIEALSGLWTVLMYLGLGVAPLVWRWWSVAEEHAP